MSGVKSKVINEIVEQLVGPVEPIGDSKIDSERLGNLRELEHVADYIIDTILLLMPYNTAPEHSVSEIGKEALKWVEFWKEGFKGELGEA